MKYIDGDLFKLAEQGEFDIVIQGCNCFCTMGSGVALTVKNNYPKAFLADQLTESGDQRKLGKFTQAHIDGKTWHKVAQGSHGVRTVNYNFTIINAYTQYGFANRDIVNVDYKALEHAFMQIKLLWDMNVQAPAKIGIPKIGAGLAGGDWDRIEQIIDNTGFSDITTVIYTG
jgi:O-acetyl-ADP-ribose deacetylase (regulator of RNase III)